MFSLRGFVQNRFANTCVTVGSWVWTVFAWGNQLFVLQNLKTTIFCGKYYIDIPSSILNIIPVNVHLFRKSQNSPNRRLCLHRKYRSDLPKVKIWQHYTACIFLYVWVHTKVFSHFYTPTLAVFRKISDRLRLSQNFEKRDFIMFPLTVLVSKPPNRTYWNCHFVKDFEENYLVLHFLWLSKMYLMLVKRWFVFVKCVRHNDGAKVI